VKGGKSKQNNSNNNILNTTQNVLNTSQNLRNETMAVNLTTMNNVENEKNINDPNAFNPNVILQTNANLDQTKNNNSRFQVNQTKYKFIETLNNDRNNTMKGNLNTQVQYTQTDINNKNGKINTTMNQSMYKYIIYLLLVRSIRM
jgi:hypothetical protein